MPKKSFMVKLYGWLGGRKMALGFFAVAVLTWGVLRVPGATYDTYALYVTLVLGFAKGTMAWEDRAKHEAPPKDDAP